jgi:putative flippase GtrA
MSSIPLGDRERLLISQFLKFGVVGLLNTAVGLGLITGLMYFLKFNPFAANAIGYSVGIVMSFVLNGRVTFGHRSLSNDMFVRFLIVCLVAYIANLATVGLTLGYNAYAAQIFGMVVYTVVNFIGCRAFAFETRGCTRNDASRTLI